MLFELKNNYFKKIMYNLLFYFSVSDLENILEISDELNKSYSKKFWIRYDWLAWTNTAKFLKKLFNPIDEYYFIQTMNKTWAYIYVKYMKDYFLVWLSPREDELLDLSKIEKLEKEFVFEMMKKLPICGIYSKFWEFKILNFSEIFEEKNLISANFSIKREENEIIFYKWRENINFKNRIEIINF